MAWEHSSGAAAVAFRAVAVLVVVIATSMVIRWYSDGTKSLLNTPQTAPNEKVYFHEQMYMRGQNYPQVIV